MRPTAIVIVLALFCAAAGSGCGATLAERRRTATVAMVSGVALAFGGLVVYGSGDDECKDIGGICLLDPIDENEFLGGLMVITGIGITGAGVIGMRGPAPAKPATAPAPPPATTRPCFRKPAQGACATPPPSDRRRTP